MWSVPDEGSPGTDWNVEQGVPKKARLLRFSKGVKKKESNYLDRRLGRAMGTKDRGANTAFLKTRSNWLRNVA